MNAFPDRPIDRVLSVMKRLRDPDTGCPWDIEQNFKSIAPHMIEEAYEVADAATRGAMDDLREELGDLLLQVVFYAQMATEDDLFTFDDIAATLADKLISRHPHVFGDHDKASNAAEVNAIWDARKAEEKKDRTFSAIDGVTLGLPALLRAQKLQKKAAKAGFTWKNPDDAWRKTEEELAELRAAATDEERKEEIGDVLFCVVNYARMHGINAEDVLARTNYKFERLFKDMEDELKSSSKNLDTASLDDMLAAWKKAKAR